MANIPRVSPEEARKLIDDEGYLYVDVRSEAEYAAGHPTGALNVPIMRAGPRGMEPNLEFLDIMQALWPKEAKLVLGCRSGQRSMRAAEMLVAAGYTNLVDQRAGFEGSRNAFGAVTEPGWSQAGLPVEASTPGGAYADILKKLGR
jgi:rhodanese-related sulfurtransferase